MERRDFLKKMLFSGTLFLCGGAKEAFAQASKEMLHHQITGKKAKKKERSWRMDIIKILLALISWERSARRPKRSLLLPCSLRHIYVSFIS